METVWRKSQFKSYFKLSLFIMMVISTCLVIWAGFTKKGEIIPFLLSVTLFLWISQVYIENKDANKKNMHRIIFVISLLSVVFGAFHIFVYR
ncbi:hypothetical protein [Halalkalibacter hemicellulosilyticus]|uniref:DUF3953 domain-containing protein n=1 Tax=Halalkalibacter hemicellulosilyticusJCM 9152 TaxID=1236971 RepID=W4QD12_9BACI|nr:hypothetical protein [Halalkalibacter hemicellulosilyticus]GAE29847.1 hypothetical protein JCM9152_1233 [Halalkalibacter hemicellulosilyticusJCM 9152]